MVGAPCTFHAPPPPPPPPVSPSSSTCRVTITNTDVVKRNSVRCPRSPSGQPGSNNASPSMQWLRAGSAATEKPHHYHQGMENAKAMQSYIFLPAEKMSSADMKKGKEGTQF